VLAAAAHDAGLLVVAQPHGARESVIVQALTRRARCPVAVIRPGGLLVAGHRDEILTGPSWGSTRSRRAE
jgi:hypothetical protein